MNKLLVIDADTILYSSAYQQEQRQCKAIHKASGRDKIFDNKTAFNTWLKENDKWSKDDVEYEVVHKMIGEPTFAFKSIKQKVEKIIDAAWCDDFVLLIEGEGNFRKDYPAKYTTYKGHRVEKPVLFNECREFMLKKYKGRIIENKMVESDDVANIYAWSSYNKARKASKRGCADVVLAYVDKDLKANSRGWMLNYNKLESGIFWNDEITQSRAFWTQVLVGDSADNIIGLGVLSEITKDKYGIRKNLKGVGPATAELILRDCETEKDMAQNVIECYRASYPDDWFDRLHENCFFLYLMRHENDRFDLNHYLESIGVYV